MEKQNETYYYEIHVSYEIPYNVLESTEPAIQKAREELYARLTNTIPERYERFSVKLVMYQLKDTLNYLVTFTTFFRSCEGLPMAEYVSARDIKEDIEEELENFFDLVDCEFRKVNIKTFI